MEYERNSLYAVSILVIDSLQSEIVSRSEREKRKILQTYQISKSTGKPINRIFGLKKSEICLITMAPLC